MAGLSGNTKDTGNVNVAVDFVWGNFPPQPNDDRGGNTLDLAQGDHSRANVAWNNYPSEPAGVNAGSRGTAHRTVPTITDQATKATTIAALKAVGFDEKDITWAISDVGATAKAYGTFKASSPAATAQTTNATDGVTITVYGSTLVSLVKNNAPSGKVVSLEPDATCHPGNSDTTIAIWDWRVVDSNGTVTRYRKYAATAFNHTFATAGTQSVYLTVTNTGGRSLESVVRNFTTT